MRRFKAHLLQIPPYTSARDEFSGEATIYLDANENNLASWSSPYHRYPDPHHVELRGALSAYLGVPVEQLLCGAGSDELIDWLLRAICEPGKDSILTVSPTYGVYATYARIHGVGVREVPLEEDFSLPVERLLAAADEYTPIAFFCRPNNPTGTLWPADSILRFIERFEGWVVLDEAYIEFSSEPQGWLPYRRDGTIILRTFSKAWGMAGWRVGYAIADPEVAALFYRTKLPYNLSLPAQQAAIKVLKNWQEVQNSIRQIQAERQRVAESLLRLSIVEKVFPSEANFLLVRFRGAHGVYQALAERGIVVRYRGSLPQCAETLRITIGTPTENDALLSALEEIDKSS